MCGKTVGGAVQRIDHPAHRTAVAVRAGLRLRLCMGSAGTARKEQGRAKSAPGGRTLHCPILPGFPSQGIIESPCKQNSIHILKRDSS